MPTKTVVLSESELPILIDSLMSLMKECSIFTFNGPLGAGKTTIIREMLKRSGITQKITSPTFAYINIYENEKGQHFYHFDLYRIESINQFLAAGFQEYLDVPDSWVFIEWPTIILPLIQEKLCSVTIDYADGSNKRLITYIW